MNILVTGAGGFLGQRVAWYLQQQGETVTALRHADLDITSSEACMETMKRHHPQWVIHCAALSSTAYCREHPEASYRVNVAGTVAVATAAKACGARLIYMSSDQVYAHPDHLWSQPPFKETYTDRARYCPGNVYGLHKLEMERQVQSLLPSSIALRLTWMYDCAHPHHMPGRPAELAINHGVCAAFAEASRSNTPLKACTREYRGITDVWEVVENIARIVRTAQSPSPFPAGIYNFGSENRLTTYNLYRLWATQWELSPTLILPDDSWSRTLSMDTSRLKAASIFFKTSSQATFHTTREEV